jgi:hypothetical protein
LSHWLRGGQLGGFFQHHFCLLDATTVHLPQRVGFVYPTPDPSVGCGQLRHGAGYIGGAVFFGG